MLYLVHENGEKNEKLLPSQSETTIPSIHPDTFKIWNWRVTPSENSCLQHLRILIRERPEIRILSSDPRLHSNWGPSFQGTRKNCLLLNQGSPNPHYILEYLVDHSAPPKGRSPHFFSNMNFFSNNLLKEKSILIACSSSSILLKHSSNAVWQVWNLHSLLSCIYTKYVTSFLYSWIQLDHDHRISAYEEKKQSCYFQIT